MSTCTVCCTELKDITVKVNNTLILDNISMHIHCNEITAVVGPNGAGKTTLFRTLLGELPYTGDIRFVQHVGGKQHKAVIGYVPQHLHFDHTTPLTVLELFAVCLRKKPVWLPIKKSFQEQVEKILEEVHLGYVLNRKIGLLSGGELQRVLLALAIMPTPDILLLDEPISGVDVRGQQLFYETVYKLKEKYHMAIVLITHELEHLEKICDRAVLLDQKVLAIGKPEVIKEQAKGVSKWKQFTIS